MPLQITETIEAKENFSSERIDYDKYEAETIEKLLSRVKDCDRENAKILLDDCLNNGIIRLELCEVEDCFSSATEIEYLEFKGVEESESLLLKRGPIKTLLLVISSGKDEELTILEVQNCLKRIEAATGQKLEPEKMYWSMVQKAPTGFLRMLVQF